MSELNFGENSGPFIISHNIIISRDNIAQYIAANCTYRQYNVIYIISISYTTWIQPDGNIIQTNLHLIKMPVLAITSNSLLGIIVDEHDLEATSDQGERPGVRGLEHCQHSGRWYERQALPNLTEESPMKSLHGYCCICSGWQLAWSQ